MERTENTLITLEEANKNADLPFAYKNRHKALASIIETKVDPTKGYRPKTGKKCTAILIAHRSLSSFLVVCYGELWTLIHKNKIIKKMNTKGVCYTYLLYFNDYYYLYNMIKDTLEYFRYDTPDKVSKVSFRFRSYGMNQSLRILPESMYLVVLVEDKRIRLFNTQRKRMGGVLFEKENESGSSIQTFFCLNKTTLMLVQTLELCLISLIYNGLGIVKKIDKIRKFRIFRYFEKNSLPLSLQNVPVGTRPKPPPRDYFISSRFNHESGVFLTTSVKTGHTHLIKIQPEKKVKTVSLLAVLNLNKEKVEEKPEYSVFAYDILGVSKNKRIAVLQVGKKRTGRPRSTEVRRLVFDLQRRKVLGRYSEIQVAPAPRLVAQVRPYKGWFCHLTGSGVRYLERVKI